MSVTDDTVVVDVGLKAEGRIPLKFHSPGEDHSVEIGQKYDVYLEKLENKEGEALLSRRARKEESWSNLEKLQDSKQQVTGVITGRVKGGYAVDIEGALAFLPGSQVDLKPIKDISPLLNKPQPMVILKMDKLRGNIVVSRRALLEESRKADRSKLLSDISEVITRKYKKYYRLWSFRRSWRFRRTYSCDRFIMGKSKSSLRKIFGR